MNTLGACMPYKSWSVKVGNIPKKQTSLKDGSAKI
jgi:hypothetical protein